jgi:hypothetical protein
VTVRLAFREKEVRTKASPVLTAVVLLVLTGHAFVVGATHFHRGWQPADAGAVASARAVRPEGVSRPSLGGGHEQCLLCRLQRNLLADLEPTSPSLGAPSAEALEPSSRPASCVRQASLHAPTGRAPPTA